MVKEDTRKENKGHIWRNFFENDYLGKATNDNYPIMLMG